ncbi:hypothetical protein AO070_19650 [Pseudomonas syringae pv. syringae PD2766]|uniref:S1 family peptidase n=1 Tax=Pseudomonas syringae TaxID=317 RepID=UPI00073621AA|nr:serine protease [Pseudomonas syringae]KTB77033.1 hypothetical protein AO070_19650 [Pseudomonas syringae pv. syringae PD2766]
MRNPEIFWTEHNLGDTRFPALFPLAALSGPNGPKLVGTAFVISAHESYAIALSVAHNFDGLKKAQQPARSRHPSALLDLFGDAEEISLEPGQVSAIYIDGPDVSVANVDWVFVDKKRDLAVFKISTHNGSSPFRSAFSLREFTPMTGDEIMVMGYDMTLEEVDTEGQNLSLSVGLRIVCRTGKVSAYHPDGHIFVRGPCIETTVPVFGGMSGGPVFIKDEEGRPMCAIGAISSDPDEALEQKQSPTYNGQSAVTLLNLYQDRNDPEGKTFALQMISGHFNFSNAEGELEPSLEELKEQIKNSLE